MLHGVNEVLERKHRLARPLGWAHAPNARGHGDHEQAVNLILLLLLLLLLARAGPAHTAVVLVHGAQQAPGALVDNLAVPFDV